MGVGQNMKKLQKIEETIREIKDSVVIRDGEFIEIKHYKKDGKG